MRLVIQDVTIIEMLFFIAFFLCDKSVLGDSAVCKYVISWQFTPAFEYE